MSLVRGVTRIILAFLSKCAPKGIMKDLRIRARSVVLNFYVRSYTLLESRNRPLAEFVAANSNEH